MYKISLHFLKDLVSLLNSIEKELSRTPETLKLFKKVHKTNNILKRFIGLKNE